MPWDLQIEDIPIQIVSAFGIQILTQDAKQIRTAPGVHLRQAYLASCEEGEIGIDMAGNISKTNVKQVQGYYDILCI